MATSFIIWAVVCVVLVLLLYLLFESSHTNRELITCDALLRIHPGDVHLVTLMSKLHVCRVIEYTTHDECWVVCDVTTQREFKVPTSSIGDKLV